MQGLAKQPEQKTSSCSADIFLWALSGYHPGDVIIAANVISFITGVIVLYHNLK